MGNAALIGVGSGRSSSCLFLQRSRGRLLFSSSPILSTDAPSSSVASARCFCSRPVLSHFSSSTAGRCSCSTGGSQDPDVALTTGEQVAPMIETKSKEVMQQAASEKMIERILASAMALTIDKQGSSMIGMGLGEGVEEAIKDNVMEAKRGIESIADKLDEIHVKLEKLENERESRNKAMKKVESGIEEIWRKCDTLRVHVRVLKRKANEPCSDWEDGDCCSQSLGSLSEEVNRRGSLKVWRK